jgi:hypothetical protein
MSAWARAADEAGHKTRAFVEEQARIGEESVEGAKKGLERMGRRREALGALKGDVG